MKRPIMSWHKTGLKFALGVPLAFAAATVLAGSNSTNLPNGAGLSVSVDDPLTGTEFKVPAGQPSINVPVSGTASVGQGDPDATFIYVMDRSGSTVFSGSGGTGCATALQCEKNFFNGLNAAVIADGSTDEAGVVTFAGNSTIVQSLVSPTNAGITNAINGAIAGGATRCDLALGSANTLVGASTNGTNIVVLSADGGCNGGGASTYGNAKTALQNAGAIVHTVAVGTNASCASGGFRALANLTVNGGQCFQVPDPGNLPNIIQNLIGSSLDSLQLAVDGGTPAGIPNSEIAPDLPQPGAANVSYGPTLANGLAPGGHQLCVTANGSDVSGGTAAVTQCETIQLLQLQASPATATNELGSDNQHTVKGVIVGGSGPDRDINFLVGGQNAGSAVPGAAAIVATPGGAPVNFNYSVPVAPASLGVDTITVSTIIAGMVDQIVVEKRWVDTTPPVGACTETVNPAGKNVPKASKTNEDGFYQLSASDDVWPTNDLDVFLTDLGSGTVFGPFAVGTNVKLTQAPGGKPSQSTMGGPNSAVAFKIKGKGDFALTATDGSGNTSAAVLCLVPPKPK